MEEKLNAPKTLDVVPSEKALEGTSGVFGFSESPTGLVSKNGGSAGVNGGKDNGVNNVVVATVAFTENCLDVGQTEKSRLPKDGVVVESVVHAVSDSVGTKIKLQNNGVSVGGDTSLSEVGCISNGEEKSGNEKMVMDEETKDCPMSPLDGVEAPKKIEPVSPLDGVESSKAIEVSRDGISLVVEVSGPPSGVIRDNPDEEKCSGLEVDAKREKGLENNGKECKFSVGDLVWVKTKNESWWPGQICDPKDASNSVAKCSLDQSLLVGYFGNGKFDWCTPFQLKPLHEDFKQISGHRKSKSFLGAIEEAVNEIGRRAKLEMTCSCILEKTKTELLGPLADNPGEKEELSAPKYKIFDLVGSFEPAEFLAHLKNLAQVVSMTGVLELAVLKNHLSAFYCSIGHCQLSMHQIRGMDDVEESAGDELAARGNVDDQVGGQDQDEFGKTPSTSLLKEPENLRDKVPHTMKTVGPAEILGQDMDDVQENHRKDVAEEEIISNNPVSKTRKRKKRGDSEARKACHEAEDGGKLASSSMEAGSSMSPTATENKGSNAGDGDGETGTKSEKGVESRERKKSKYLSPPYINLKWRRKGPVLENSETEDPKVSKVSCDGVGMDEASEQLGAPPSVVKCSGKAWRKRSRKSINESTISGDIGAINVSSSVMLSELRCAALDCLYPSERENFGSIVGFVNRFRRSVYSEASQCKVNEKNVNGEKEALAAEPSSFEKESLEIKPLIKPERKKRKKKEKEMVTLKDLAELSASIPDGSGNHVKSSLLGKDPAGDELSGVNGHVQNIQEMCRESSKGKHGGKVMKKKEGTSSKRSKTKPTPGLLDVNVGIVTSSSLMNDSGEIKRLAPNGKPEPNKRKKEGVTSERLHTKFTAGIPDLNGSSPVLSPSKEDVRVMSTVALEGNGNNAKPSPSMKDLPGMGLHSFGVVIPGLNDREGVSVNGNFTISLSEVNGNTAKFSLMAEDSQATSLLAPGGKLKPRKRKRKEKETMECPKINCTANNIPDLNGNSAEPNSSEKQHLLEINCLASKEVKPERKKRRRRRKGELGNKIAGGMPDINNVVGHTAGALGTTLTLTFSQGSPMPSKETLVEAFSKFGPLKESETKVLNNSLYAQIVFIRNSDAREAVRSLEKCSSSSSPFGAALVNFQLNHYSSSASMALEHHQQIVLASQHVEPLKTLARPPPSGGEVPPLFYIRQNLEMMTSMLEKSGDDLSPDMRAKLEGEIKGLLKKVSSMVGSSSSN